MRATGMLLCMQSIIHLMLVRTFGPIDNYFPIVLHYLAIIGIGLFIDSFRERRK